MNYTFNRLISSWNRNNCKWIAIGIPLNIGTPKYIKGNYPILKLSRWVMCANQLFLLHVIGMFLWAKCEARFHDIMLRLSFSMSLNQEARCGLICSIHCDTNYDYWKVCMVAFLKSIDKKTWKEVINGWIPLMVRAQDNTPSMKLEEDWFKYENE